MYNLIRRSFSLLLLLLLLAPDSPISRKSKSQRLDSHNTCPTMKCLTSAKHRPELERENLYTPTPPQMKSTETICNTQRRPRPPVPIRTDSSRSLTRSVDSSGGSSSIVESETSPITPNNRCLNLPSNGHFVPLQSVQEDESLDVNTNEQKASSKVNAIDQSRERELASIMSGYSLIPDNEKSHTDRVSLSLSRCPR